MAEGEDKTIECGFCCRRSEDLEKPKMLPCRHVHCFGCLTAFFEINHMTRCPVSGCGEVVDVPLDTLPSHDMDKDNSKWCDVCIIKRLGNKPAVIYCTNCDKKYCIKHEEFHDELTEGHKKKPVSEYEPQPSSLRDRECKEHKDQMYSLGCRHCLTLICLNCVPGLTTCADGKQHKLMKLDELVATLVEDDVRVHMTAKEEKLEKLFKVTSKVSSEYDVKTAEMIQLLRDTRDEQLKVIREKYDKLEEELMENRQKKRLELAEYLEDEVLAKWTQLRNQIHKIETKLKHSHQVDIVKGFSELKEQLQKLVDEELPKLEMTDLVDLSKKEESRYIELGIASSDDMSIDSDSEQGFHPSARLPKSLQHLRSVQTSDPIPSISQYKGNIYVALGSKGIARITRNNQLDGAFITSSERVDYIVVHEDRLYVLLPYGTPVVRVYEMVGRQITQWNVTCGSHLHNAMAIVSDQLVIADQPNKRLSVYSLSGQLLRSVPCTLLGGSYLFMSAVDDFSVVISVYGACNISRVNVGTGEVMWTCNPTTNPGSVTCYSRRYALVASYSKNKIWTVDNHTGTIVSELAAEALGGMNVFGLQVFGDTLVAASYSSQKLAMFKMNF